MFSPNLFRYAGTFYLVYDVELSADGHQRVAYATAPAVTGPWTKSATNPIVQAGLVENIVCDAEDPLQQPLLIDGYYWMVYATCCGGTVRLSRTADPTLMTWTDYPGNPVLSPGLGPNGQEEYVFSPHLFRYGGTFYLVYDVAVSVDGRQRLAYATAPAVDRTVDEGSGRDGSQFGLKVTYIEQEAPLGLAHAVKISEPFMAGDSFVMYLGDNLIKDGVTPFVREFQAERPDAQILLAHVKTPWEFGVAELAGDRVVRLEEKPKQPRSDLALVGVYLFDETVFEAVNAIRPSARGELEITDAIQYLIDRGRRVRSHVITGW